MSMNGEDNVKRYQEEVDFLMRVSKSGELDMEHLMKLRPLGGEDEDYLKRYQEEVGLLTRVSKSGRFDMKSRLSSCLLGGEERLSCLLGEEESLQREAALFMRVLKDCGLDIEYLLKLRLSSCSSGGEAEDYLKGLHGEVGLFIQMLEAGWFKYLIYDVKEVIFLIRLAKAGGFDIEHLMESRPSSCSLRCFSNCNNNLDDLHSWEVFLYARMGIHKYNMIQGTNLELSYIEKYNLLRKQPLHFTYNITLAAKDPDAGGSLVPFQATVVVIGRGFKKISCPVARIKPGPQENHSLQQSTRSVTGTTVDVFYKGAFPVWPSSDDVFADENHFYVLKESELLREYDWIHLYLELAFHTSNWSLLPNPKLSKLKIVKVMVETDSNVQPPGERLRDVNAVFYIKYRYHPHNKNKGRRAPKSPHHIPPCERGAVVRRTMDMNTGLLALEFDPTTFQKGK